MNGLFNQMDELKKEDFGSLLNARAKKEARCGLHKVYEMEKRR
jgi:hypothetical protein